MRIRLWIAASLALGMMAVAACDREEDRHRTGTRPDDRHTTSQAPTAISDEDFMKMACQTNLAEIEAGRLAEVKGIHADVKKFAEHMVEDHTASNDQLTALAEKLNFRLPTTPDGAQQKELAKLTGLIGAEFDRRYSETMVTDHQKAVALFEKFSKDAKHDDVRAWAEKTLPKLRDHLTMARDLHGKIGGPPPAD